MPANFLFAIYSMFWLALAINFAGYIYLLVYIRRVRPPKLVQLVSGSEHSDYPHITCIIPVYNEERNIRQKLENFFGLDYPSSHMHALLIDGHSTDATIAIANELARKNPSWDMKAIECKIRGKIPQLNQALEMIPDEHIVIVSDADAQILDKSALKTVANVLQFNSKVGLVGGWCGPPNQSKPNIVIDSEHAYWDKQNRLRYMEMQCFTSSIIIAPFYAFRRTLIDYFPQDCVADDVFISFFSHLREFRVLYLPTIHVLEIRQPANLYELFWHKLRKTHAYTKELLRVAYQLPEMSKRLKFFYVFKLFQFFYLPWACLGFVFLSFYLLMTAHWQLFTWSFTWLGIMILLASVLVEPPPKHTRGGMKLRSIFSSLVIFVIMVLVLILNFFLFPFIRQNSSYRRVSIDLNLETNPL